MVMAAAVPIHFPNVSSCYSEKLMTLQMSEKERFVTGSHLEIIV